MSLILNIDTTGPSSFVCLANDGNIIAIRTNYNQQDHAAFLHPAIKELMQEAGFSFNELNAIAVCNGPGSYTGIRIGVSAAKGLALALEKPIIMVDSLTILAKDAMNQVNKKDAFYCSMIDARRLEVYYAVYNYDLDHIISPGSIILNESTLSQMKGEFFFTGSGSEKFIGLFSGIGHFLKEHNTALALSELSYTLFKQNKFSDLIYSDAFYVKDFHDSKK